MLPNPMESCDTQRQPFGNRGEIGRCGGACGKIGPMSPAEAAR